MTTPLTCLLVVATLPYVLAVVGDVVRLRTPQGLDNRLPRAQYEGMHGIGARAWAAQANAWEALTIFAVAVLLAHLSGANAESAATASVVYVATRVLHPVMYLADWATARSMSFLVGLVCLIRLFYLSAVA